MSRELIEQWYQAERQQHRYQREDAGVTLGFPLWGESYVRCFLDYVLPSMMAPANIKALRTARAELVLYVDRPTYVMLERAISRHAPGFFVRLVSDNVMQMLHRSPEWKYVMLTAVQKLLLQQAAAKGAGFSTATADIIYSERYFERLFALGRTHAAIAHQTPIASRNTGAAAFDALRRDGVLALSAAELGNLGWQHVSGLMRSWCLNDNETYSTMPGTHYIVWRGRNSLRMHCPHITPVWLNADLCRAAPTDLGVTLDASGPTYMGPDFYTPTLADDMSFITLDDSRDHPADQVSFQVFKDGFQRFLYCRDQFKVPVMVPTLPAEDAFLPDDVIEQRFQKLVAMLGC